MASTRRDLPAGDRMERMLDAARAGELERASRDWPSLPLVGADLDTLELILTGAYHPLEGYMSAGEVALVEGSGRLASGEAWPAPVTLVLPAARATGIAAGDRVALRDPEGVLLAALDVTEVTEVASGRTRLAGPVIGVRLPSRPGLERWRRTPEQVVEEARTRGWERTVAFEVDGPVHRAEVVGLGALLEREPGAGLLVVYEAEPRALTDPHHMVHIACLEEALAALPRERWLVMVSPGGGPRELRELALRHCGVDWIVADTGTSEGTGTTEAMPRQRLAPLLGLTRHQIDTLLERGDPVPDDASWPAVLDRLRRLHPPRARRGFTVFFTGLSGSGKSTIAQRLIVRLMETTVRRITLLDGDRVRLHLSSELNFSREHRDLNIRRIGFVAAEITRHGGVAVCAPIAPYESVRAEVRRLVEAEGGFFLVHVSTALAVCEDRDRKGLYAKARAGLLKGFTGIDDPYEEPPSPDLAIDTARLDPEAAVDLILDLLRTRGWLPDK